MAIVGYYPVIGQFYFYSFIALHIYVVLNVVIAVVEESYFITVTKTQEIEERAEEEAARAEQARRLVAAQQEAAALAAGGPGGGGDPTSPRNYWGYDGGGGGGGGSDMPRKGSDADRGKRSSAGGRPGEHLQQAPAPHAGGRPVSVGVAGHQPATSFFGLSPDTHDEATGLLSGRDSPAAGSFASATGRPALASPAAGSEHSGALHGPMSVTGAGAASVASGTHSGTGSAATGSATGVLPLISGDLDLLSVPAKADSNSLKERPDNKLAALLRLSEWEEVMSGQSIGKKRAGSIAPQTPASAGPAGAGGVSRPQSTRSSAALPVVRAAPAAPAALPTGVSSSSLHGGGHGTAELASASATGSSVRTPRSSMAAPAPGAGPGGAKLSGVSAAAMVALSSPAGSVHSSLSHVTGLRPVSLAAPPRSARGTLRPEGSLADLPGPRAGRSFSHADGTAGAAHARKPSTLTRGAGTGGHPLPAAAEAAPAAIGGGAVHSEAAPGDTSGTAPPPPPPQ